jgi:hypothetical protein
MRGYRRTVVKLYQAYYIRNFNVWTEIYVHNERRQTLARPHVNFQFIENVKIYSCLNELCVSWPTLSNRHWHKILFLWAQIYVFILDSSLCLCLCCKVFSTRMWDNKVRRGMRTGTLKDEIIALSTFAVNCPHFFYIQFY